MTHNLLFLLLFFFISIQLYCQEILLLKNVKDSATTFLLMKNEEIIDSLKIGGIDYDYTWSSRINDSLFHYIYDKFPNDSNSIYRFQILIYINKTNLNIAFASEKQLASLPRGKLRPGRGRLFYDNTFDLDFEKLDVGQIILKSKEVIVEEKYPIKRDTIYNDYYFRFDPINKVFYNRIDTIHGKFDFQIQKKGKVIGYKEVYIHEIAPSIAIMEYKLSYINHIWFLRANKDKILISKFRDILPEYIEGVTKYPKSMYDKYELIKEWKVEDKNRSD